MKTLLVLLVLGVIASAFGWQYYQHHQNPTMADRAAFLSNRAREMAMESKDLMSAKAREWRLTPDDIREEMRKTGQVVRSRAVAVGEKLDDVRIIAVIKAKFIAEKNLSSFDIAVDCEDGAVKLTGSVVSPAQIGRAVELALQTTGVHHVISGLSLKT